MNTSDNSSKINVRANDTHRMFYVGETSRDGGVMSCLGFDACYRNASQLAETLGEPALDPEKIGSVDQYVAYQALLDKARQESRKRDLGTWFEPGTPEAVKLALEAIRASGSRCRLFYGDSDSGKDWLEEHGMIGRIGRSSGPLKSPILLPNTRSGGGPSILTRNVVKIVELSPRTGQHKEVYRHPKYHQPVLWIRPGGQDEPRYMVYAGGVPHAGFGTKKKAQAFIAFMRGIRFSQ